MSFQGDGGNNYEIFRDCVSGAIVQKSESKTTKVTKKKAQKARRDAKKVDVKQNTADSVVEERSDPEELAEFIDVSFLLTT
jgi:uncharacterized protein YaiL (DUF2058 family)